MNCHTYEADLVDLARGIPLEASADANLRAHLDQCPACAMRLAREQSLTAELRRLSAATPAPAGSAAIEARLLEAFAAQQGCPAGPMPASAVPAGRWWLAAAATVLLAAGAWLATRPSPATADKPAAMQARAAAAEPAPAPQAPAPRAEQVRPEAGETPDTVGTPSAGPASRRAQPPARRRAARAVPAGDDEVMRFVTLPSAEGLPVLESGRIVRIDLPMAFLPAHGIEVAPEDASRVVEADVLVGQDGQPRAIRFVGLDSDSRRR